MGDKVIGTLLNRRGPLLALLLAAGIAALALSPVAAEPRALTLGVHDHSNEAKIRTSAEPFAKYLATVLGVPVKLVICPDYQELARRFIAGELAFAVFPAYVYYRTARITDMKLLATLRYNNADTYRGAILTRRDGGIEKLADLKGKRFAFVSEDSASGYLYPRVLLAKAGINPKLFFASMGFKGSHPSVVRAIVNGEIDAGAVFEDEIRYFVDEGGDISNVKVIDRTDPVPFDAFVAQTNIPAALAKSITDALVKFQFAQGVDGRMMFAQWAAPDDRLYDPVREAVRILDEARQKQYKILRFGMFPKVTVEVSLGEMKPLFQYLERETGCKIIPKFSPNLLDVGRRLLVGDTDFAIISPFAYVETTDRARLKPKLIGQQVIHGSNLYHGVVLARKEKGTLAKLAGGRFAFVDPDSSSGRLMPLVWFKRQGIDATKHFGSVYYAGTHTKAFEDLMAGRADAIACGDFVYEQAKREKRAGVDDLVVLHRSETIPHECMIARGDLTPELVKKLKAAILKLDPSNPAHAAILSAMGYERFLPGDDSAYDALRRLKPVLLRSNAK